MSEQVPIPDINDVLRAQSLEAQDGLDPLSQSSEAARLLPRLPQVMGSLSYAGTVMAEHPSVLMFIWSGVAVTYGEQYKSVSTKRNVLKNRREHDATLAAHGHVAEVVPVNEGRPSMIWHGFSEQAASDTEAERRTMLSQLSLAVTHADLSHVLVPKALADSVFPDSRKDDTSEQRQGVEETTLVAEWDNAGLARNIRLKHKAGQEPYRKFTADAFAHAVHDAGELHQRPTSTSPGQIVDILRKRRHPIARVWDTYAVGSGALQPVIDSAQSSIERRSDDVEMWPHRLPNNMVVGVPLSTSGRLDRNGPRYEGPKGQLRQMAFHTLEVGHNQLQSTEEEVKELVDRLSLKDESELTDADVAACEKTLYLMLIGEVASTDAGDIQGVGHVEEYRVLPPAAKASPTLASRVHNSETIDRSRKFVHGAVALLGLTAIGLGVAAGAKYDERYEANKRDQVHSAESRVADAKYAIDSVIAYVPNLLKELGAIEESTSSSGTDENRAEWQIDGNNHNTQGYWASEVDNTYVPESNNWTQANDGGFVPHGETDGVSKILPVKPTEERAAEFIKVTSSPLPYYNKNSSVNIPVLEGTEPVAANFAGLPVELTKKSNGTYSIGTTDKMMQHAEADVLGNKYINGNMTYWLNPSPDAELPHAYDIRRIGWTPDHVSEYQSREIIDAWYQVMGKNMEDSIPEARERAAAMKRQYVYKLNALGPYRAGDGRWHVGDDYVASTLPVIADVMSQGGLDCYPANTALALSSTELNLASGYHNGGPNKAGEDVISSHERHAWTVTPDGEVIDATPSSGGDKYADYFSEEDLEPLERLPTVQERERRKDRDKYIVAGLTVLLAGTVYRGYRSSPELQRAVAMRRLRRRSVKRLAEDKAVVDMALYGANDIRLDEVPKADPGQDKQALAKSLYDRREGVVAILKAMNRNTYRALPRKAMNRAIRTMRDIEKIRESELDRVAEPIVRFKIVRRAGNAIIGAFKKPQAPVVAPVGLSPQEAASLSAEEKTALYARPLLK